MAIITDENLIFQRSVCKNDDLIAVKLGKVGSKTLGNSISQAFKSGSMVDN